MTHKRFSIGLAGGAALLMMLAAAAASAQQFNPALYSEMRWRMIGPFRGGRTRAVCGVASQPNVFYIGAVNGGVWKSDDYGRTWNPIFDDQPTQSIGAIAVAPSDPNIVYVASGEGLQRPDLSVGDGIYKSTDAGKTWTHLGLRDGEQIPTLAVDPRDPNRLFAAVLGHPYGANAERGIFRSTDGGATWQKVLYQDENTGGSDIEMDPSNPDVLYAGLWEARQGPWEDANEYGGTEGGIFKSTDGGTTWAKLAGGLPADVVQADIAIAPSNTRILYASVALARGTAIYRSGDAGATWSKTTDDHRPAVRIGGGDLAVSKVDPKNPDVLYMTSTVTWKSTDGGKTWTGFRGAPGGDDYQNIWINPNNPQIIAIVSDQGAIVSVNGGVTWGSWYNQPTAQMYHVITDNQFPYRVYGGQQESGSVGTASRGNDGEVTFREWHPVGVIEYGYAAPDPLHPDIVYGAGRSQVSRFNWTTGQVQDVTPIPSPGDKYRTDRTEPLVFSPVDPHTLYYASNVLFKTTDGGEAWQTISPDLTRPHPGIPASLGNLAAKDAYAAKVRGAIYAVAPSFKDVNTLWAGTDDGLIWITLDGGKNWKDITPPEFIPWSKVTQLAASHFDNLSAYASVSRFRIDDLHPFIYRTHDGGKSWQKIVAGLPDDAPVDTVREDPARKGLLYAGTEKAVWVSFDDGDHWQSLQMNLPHTSMRDLWIHDDDLIVATHGRSFWILDDITPLRQISQQVEESEAYLFRPETAWRVMRDTNTDTPLPPDEPAGENPPDGAILNYYLKSDAPEPVTLEILDHAGKTVRRFSSADAVKPPDPKDVEVPYYWVKLPQALSAEAGMHRFVWDLHYPAPQSAFHEYPISAVPHDTPRGPLGPTALPGEYTVELTVRGHTYSQPLVVKLDPRLKPRAAGLERQFELETSITAGMNQSYAALERVRKLRAQLKDRTEKAGKGAGNKSLTDAIAALDKKAAAIEGGGGFFFGGGGESLSRSNAGMAALLGALSGADAAPTAAQVAAVGELKHGLGRIMARWNELESKDVPALDSQLQAAGLAAVQATK